ncbi:microcystin-dependent protein [Aneurinibacillus soli]|uniref:Phage Tail Collar Domain protein n=1 Tax=Aneurinibacillus soli TaxID=1500254 RepID=A0A0U5ATJ1_9BACL|nr:tail fiber protein [Aneurinibacillus soli]PYE62510.1 microcystin-dependent protein [Aneurinibacillus soli]BAU27073.1 Phage Tail Collar Domain protein [Aneurinibacillus soli]
MSEPFIGEIRMFSMNYPPQGWALCNGQLLSINSNQALYSLIGTAFGGNGTTTFALPNLQGRVPTQMPNISAVGQSGGEEAHALTISEMPAHTHQAYAGSEKLYDTPVGNVWGTSTPTNYAPQANSQMHAHALAQSGGSQAHSNMQPYTVVNFCIALTGIYPSRN